MLLYTGMCREIGTGSEIKKIRRFRVICICFKVF